MPRAEEFKSGEWVRLTYAGRFVTVVELIGPDKALVRWQTDGKKAPGGRYWLRPPQTRKKVVRLSSLEHA